MMSILFLLVVTLLSATTTASMAEQRTRPMAGGYAPVPDLETNERLLNAANFAVSSLKASTTGFRFVATLPPETDYSIIVPRAFQQVVAGINYKMIVVITSSSNSDIVLGAFGVTVYDHFGDLSVTKWGKEVPKEKAKAMLENMQDFGETAEADEEFEKLL